MEYAGLQMVQHDGVWYFENREMAASFFEQYLVHIDDRSEDRQRKRTMAVDQQMRRAAFMGKYELVEKYLRTWRLGLVANPNFRPNRNSYDMCDKSKNEATKWFDHDRLFWNKANQRYVLTTQPYDVSLEKFALLEQYCTEREIQLTISYDEAWHYPGRCPLITLWGKSKGGSYAK